MSRPRSRLAGQIVLFILVLGVLSLGAGSSWGAGDSPYAHWTNGPSPDPAFFPIGVWLQDPRDAKAYKAAGVNVFIGLWKGPTKEQLNQLKLTGMPVICDQNETGLIYKDEKIIIGWMHSDEPDNAQPLPIGVGYGSPVPPEEVQKIYQNLHEADPTRPVLLNLGQGVAWDGWWGRGPRSGHPEDYPLYVKGCDIASFDIYPLAHEHADVAGKLWYPAEGVQRLLAASTPPKIVWNVIEAAGIHSNKRPTPAQIRSEVWMSIINGSRGIIYFVHEFKPEFCSRVLLKDSDLYKGVSQINAGIHELAPAINSLAPAAEIEVVSSNLEIPLATLAKRAGGTDYLFTAAMREGVTTGQFKLKNPVLYTSVEVLEESRTLNIVEGAFSDEFKDYGVHLYRFKK